MVTIAKSNPANVLFWKITEFLLNILVSFFFQPLCHALNFLYWQVSSKVWLNILKWFVIIFHFSHAFWSRTIPTLRQHIFLLFLTHLPYMSINSKNFHFSDPTHPVISLKQYRAGWSLYAGLTSFKLSIATVTSFNLSMTSHDCSNICLHECLLWLQK